MSTNNLQDEGVDSQQQMAPEAGGSSAENDESAAAAGDGNGDDAEAAGADHTGSDAVLPLHARAKLGPEQVSAYHQALESKIQAVQFAGRKWAGSLEKLMAERNKPENVYDIPNTKQARAELGRVRTVITAACEEIKMLQKVDVEKHAAITMLHSEIQRLREQVFILKSMPPSVARVGGGGVGAGAADTAGGAGAASPEDHYISQYMNAARDERGNQVPVAVAVTKYPDHLAVVAPPAAVAAAAAADATTTNSSNTTAAAGAAAEDVADSHRPNSSLFFKQPSDKHLLAAAKRFKPQAKDIRRMHIEDASRLTDAGITAIAGVFDCLEAFEVTLSNKVTDDGIAALAQNCPRLRVLNLSYCNNIGNAALKVLGRCVRSFVRACWSERKGGGVSVRAGVLRSPRVGTCAMKRTEWNIAGRHC
jgi:hypothetical protein